MSELRNHVWFPVDEVKKHSFMFMPIFAPLRNELMVYLEERGIQTRTMMPLIHQPIARKYARKKLSTAEYVDKFGLLIGCHQYLTKKDLKYIVSTIKEFYDGKDSADNWI
jgi:dTDP-4-amino-4,6-dideoxygalactose transaminase